MTGLVTRCVKPPPAPPLSPSRQATLAVMKAKPRMAKAHSKQVADEYLRLGWTLRREFRNPADAEPYEYFFEWLREDEPVSIDWSRFRDGHNAP